MNALTLAIFFCNSLLILFFFHYLLRRALQLRCSRLKYWQCYMITTSVISAVQAICIGFISLRTVLIVTDIMHQRDRVFETYIFLLIGYFFYDVVVMFYGFWLKRDSNGQCVSFCTTLRCFCVQEFFMLVHHAILQSGGMATFYYVVHGRGIGVFFMAGICVAELSTPFYSIRGVLKQLGYIHTKVYEVNGIIFMVSFFVFRVLVIPYLFCRYAHHEKIPFYSVPYNIPFICTVSSLAFMTLQVYWFIMILRVGFRHVANKTMTRNLHNNSVAVNGNKEH